MTRAAAVVVVAVAACAPPAVVPRPVTPAALEPAQAKIVTAMPPMDPDPSERGAWMTTPVAPARTPVTYVMRQANNTTLVRFALPDPRIDATWRAVLLAPNHRPERCWIRRVGRHEAECTTHLWPIWAARGELELSPPEAPAAPSGAPPSTTKLRMRHPPPIRAGIVFVEPADDRFILTLLVGSADGIDRKYTCRLLVPNGGSEYQAGSYCAVIRIDRTSSILVVRDVATRELESGVVELRLP